jgi:hypothetical protein
MVHIDDKLRFDLKSLTALITLSAWLAFNNFQTNANAKQILKIESREDKINQMAINIALMQKDVADMKIELKKSVDQQWSLNGSANDQ